MNRLESIPILSLFKRNKLTLRVFFISCAVLMLISLLAFQLLPNFHWLKFEILIGEIQKSTGDSIRSELKSKARLDEFLSQNEAINDLVIQEVYDLWNRDNYVFIHNQGSLSEVGSKANFTCKYLGIVGDVSNQSVEVFKSYVVHILTQGIARDTALVQQQQLEMLLKDIANLNESLESQIAFLEDSRINQDLTVDGIDRINFSKLDRSVLLNMLSDHAAKKQNFRLRRLEEMKRYRTSLLATAPVVEGLARQYQGVVNLQENIKLSPTIEDLLREFSLEAEDRVRYLHIIDPLPVFPLFAQVVISTIVAIVGGVLLLMIHFLRARLKNAHADV